MEFNDFDKKIKEEFPDKAIDISEALELLRETISESIEAIRIKMNTALINRKFDKVDVYNNMAKEANGFENEIDNIINLFKIEEIDVINEIGKVIEKENTSNYDDYIVDNKVEHTLYENLTHKRPFAFKLNKYHVIEVKTWQDMLIKTCEYLMTIDEKKFLTFEEDDKMNGKKNKYFSINPNNLRKSKKVKDEIFVEMNLSSNGIRNLIVKLLKAYDFQINEYKIYFRADYSNLNKK